MLNVIKILSVVSKCCVYKETDKQMSQVLNTKYNLIIMDVKYFMDRFEPITDYLYLYIF